jgi:lipoate-protein ligase A
MPPVRCILNTRTQPAFNLALEEWLLRNARQDLFMLWRNAPAVIVGRHQNTTAEIDPDFVRLRGIAVVRRITGGGAVFHDLGNVNFSFVSIGHGGGGMDFRRFTAPVLEALRGMGVDCSFDGRNDLVIEGRKFSGNAQHVEGGRVLHHGTLLFDPHLEDLAGALRASPLKFQGKAVKSLSARVTMLKRHLPHLDAEGFMRLFMERMTRILSGARRDAEKEEEAAAGELARSKYENWDWNFGVSPAYAFSRRARVAAGTLEVRLDVREGIVRAACIRGDFFALRPIEDLEELLRGCRHERDALLERLRTAELDGYIRGLDAREFADCLL